ncbi:XrtA/PEP-CTERM system histidine kinase PrsK [Thiocystis violascens]|uniref:histidine kinase n=1 Tax=Thiocystis violascens (strain ATCC 17096 / DSM 198 / 6111) TaxID=765911 RepID=I3YGF5_THIV6|nr:XrtA/PEP-CTERM system histidine kinase PrsK [Thiocystis violascens]AFL76073.1 putative PEP-CTERM system histidine kinase [Thiocystis violascens DSM 198]
MTVGLFSYLAALLAYLLLTVLLITSWRGRLMGLFAVLAAVATAAWAMVNAILLSDLRLPAQLPAIVELARNGAWLIFLAHILVADHEQQASRLWIRAAWGMIGLGGLLTVVLPAIVASLDRASSMATNATLLGWTLQAIVGLLLVEQVFRNRRLEKRGEIKHLCLGLGAVFAYDLFFYSDALLMHRIDPGLWEARGIVNALIVPLIAVSAARNPSWSLEVHVSRHVVFHSATLSGAGIYLMAMAAAGYYIRYFGGTWGALLQIAFLFSAGIFLLLLLFSGQWRAQMRVLLSRHFFSFKYDYREEWLRFTEALSRRGASLPEAIVTALGGIVDSPGGMLWVMNEYGVYELMERVNLPEPGILVQPAEHPMVHFMMRLGWVVDLDEYRLRPELYEDFDLPEWLEELPAAWLIIPLLFRDQMCGFVVLARSRIKRSFNWEDRSLLRTAGHQAASYVAQHLADQALIRARQFEAFSQLSAYVAHDLKNLLAQQSLIVSNAEKHKHNPAFIEDVITTIKSSVERMNRLMNQLRDGVRGEPQTCVRLDDVIREAIAAHADRNPKPQTESLREGLRMKVDKERLRTIFGHLIQNAQEATRPDGSVRIRLDREGRNAVIDIEDDGIGMSPEFIRDRLFRPFDSTKGLTGMGIGAFESREFVRLLGGDLMVRSHPGRGTLFRVFLPCDEPASGPAETRDD